MLAPHAEAVPYTYCGWLSLSSERKRKGYDRALHEPNRVEVQTQLVNLETNEMGTSLEKRMKLYEHDDAVRQAHDNLGNIIQSRVVQPQINQLAEGLRMASEALQGGPGDVNRLRAEFVDLSSCQFRSVPFVCVASDEKSTPRPYCNMT